MNYYSVDTYIIYLFVKWSFFNHAMISVLVFFGGAMSIQFHIVPLNLFLFVISQINKDKMP